MKEMNMRVRIKCTGDGGGDIPSLQEDFFPAKVNKNKCILPWMTNKIWFLPMTVPSPSGIRWDPSVRIQRNLSVG